MSPDYFAKGVNGEICLYQNKITILKKGLFGRTVSEKDITLSSISAIQFQNATRFKNGYIRVSFWGGSERKMSSFSAVDDENTVVFSKKEETDFSKLKQMVERYQAGGTLPKPIEDAPLENETTQDPIKPPWYDNKILVPVLVIFFFPVGLYGLWKSDKFSKTEKYSWSMLCGLLLLMTLISDTAKTPTPAARKPEVIHIPSQKERQEMMRQQAQEERKEAIEKQFNPWDGSHINLTRVIKLSMNDPDSYSHAQTTYSDHGDYLIVQTAFRGKNPFGGVVLQRVKAKVAMDGEVLNIIE